MGREAKPNAPTGKGSRNPTRRPGRGAGVGEGFRRPYRGDGCLPCLNPVGARAEARFPPAIVLSPYRGWISRMFVHPRSFAALSGLETSQRRCVRASRRKRSLPFRRHSKHPRAISPHADGHGSSAPAGCQQCVPLGIGQKRTDRGDGHPAQAHPGFAREHRLPAGSRRLTHDSGLSRHRLLEFDSRALGQWEQRRYHSRATP